MSSKLKSTKSLVKEYRAAMANITTGWCSDLETRRVYSVGMNGGKAFGRPKASRTHHKLKQAS